MNSAAAPIVISTIGEKIEFCDITFIITPLMENLAVDQLAIIASLNPQQLELFNKISVSEKAAGDQTEARRTRLDKKLRDFNDAHIRDLFGDRKTVNPEYLDYLKFLDTIFRNNHDTGFVAIVAHRRLIDTTFNDTRWIIPVMVNTKDGFAKMVNIDKLEKFIAATHTGLLVNWVDEPPEHHREYKSPIFTRGVNIQLCDSKSFNRALDKMHYDSAIYQNVKIYWLHDINGYLRAKAISEVFA